VGFVHAEDLIDLVLDGTDTSQVELQDLLHPLVVVIPTKKVDEMFDYLLQQKAKAAVVINEFGGVEGLVAISQVLEHAFGHAAGAVAGEELYERPENGVFSVPGDMKLNVFNDLTHFHIHDQRMTTIGGVVLRYLDRLPTVGDRVVVEGVLLEVLEMDGLRIGQVSATPDTGTVTTVPKAGQDKVAEEEED
jgi:CBS domain containing-hemolysin-like protein